MKKLSLRDGFTTIGDAIRLWWADWSNQLVVSLAAILLSLTVVLYPVALFGVYFQAVDLTHDLRTGLGGFWSGFKRYWKPALQWGIVNTLGVAVFSFSLWFYGNSNFFLAPVFVWASFLALAFWLTWQLLSVACFFLQEPQTLRLAWKNGLALLLSHPIYLLPISIFMLALTFISLRYFIPLVAGSEALLALLSLRSIQNTI
jgi:hypothetical protein